MQYIYIDIYRLGISPVVVLLFEIDGVFFYQFLWTPANSERTELRREGGREEGGREGGRDGWMEGGREGGMDGGRDGWREGGRE